MDYSLIVDIGNSQTEFAVFFDEELVGKARVKTEKITEAYDDRILTRLFEELQIGKQDVKRGLIFSVVPHLTRFVQILVKGAVGFEIPIFDVTKIDGFKTSVDDPKEVGHDIVADILGAIHFYGFPIVISDLGTVTKNIVIDKNGEFVGVTFFPGLRSSARSLSGNTAQLPELKEIIKPDYFIGKNTEQAMRAGIYFGHLAAITRFMSKVEESFGYKFKKVVTGGYAHIYEGEVPEDVTIDTDLVLKGMNVILKYHVKK